MTNLMPSSVWIVDDSALDTEILSRALSADHRLHTFADGSSMLEYLVGHAPPDALVLDWTLPDMNGLEVCRFLRSNPATSQVGVIMLTGIRVTIEDLAECMAAGANDYLIKPMRPAELAARVNALVRSSVWRRRAEHAETALRTLLDQQPDAVFAVDAESNITFANTQALAIAGRSAIDVLGRPMRDMFPQFPDLVTSPPAEVQLGDRVYSPAVKKLVVDAGPASVTVSLRDVTDVVESARARDEFLAMLSHELRNPLAPIRSAAELLLRVPADEARVLRAAQVIERQTLRMVRLIDQLLEASRVTRGRIDLQREKLDLANVLRHAVENTQTLLTSNGHTLELTLPDQPLPVDGDAVRLEQVFSNLLDNAAKYTPNGGHMSVAAERQGDAIVVRVRDNGIGIAAANFERVFVMFHQAKRDLDRAQGGLGVGLSVVKTLIEMHGGSVSVSSAGENQGSEFVVRLPSA